MILGTAGHVDHGKSALVEALTGRAMDPLPEERRRGVTLDLHVVPLSLPDGSVVSVIDVPGHEDLVRTMIAGAAGIELVLLVVAANEGIMPQTREHLLVLEELGLRSGIPVITKAELVEPDWMELVALEVSQWLEGSAVRFTAPIAVSARTGSGLDRLLNAIQLARSTSLREELSDLPRLPVDRVLTVAGTGTVVAGTVASGSFRPGDAIRLIPSGLEGRVRSAERHGQSVDLVRRGERAALGLSGLEASRVHRGEVVVSAETEWTPSLRLDVEVRLAPDAPLALKQGTRLRVALGTAEVLGRVRLCGTVQQGAVSAAQLVLEAPLVARGGDRFILRSYSPVTVVGGGTVIDPHPPAGRPDFPPGLDPGSAASRLRLVASRSAAGLRRDQAAIRAGLDPASVGPVALAEGLIVDGETVLDPGMLARVEALAMDLVQGFHSDQPASPGIPLETLRASLRKQAALAAVAIRRLQESGQVMVTSGVVSRVGFRPSVTSREGDLERLLAAVAARGLESWAVEELGRSAGVDDVVGLLKLAEREGRVAAVERGWFVARSALDGFARDLALIAARGPITPAAVREATGLSRKHLIPLLEWADREGLTIRSGEARIPGPRLARP